MKAALLYSSGYMDGLCGTPRRDLPSSDYSDIYHQGYNAGEKDGKSLPPVEDEPTPKVVRTRKYILTTR